MNPNLREIAPVSLNDVLMGVQYATAFDGKGYVLPVERRTKNCRKAMLRIVSATGNRPPPSGVVTLNAQSRALQARWRGMAALVATHCSVCPHFSDGECAGANLLNEDGSPRIEAEKCAI